MLRPWHKTPIHRAATLATITICAALLSACGGDGDDEANANINPATTFKQAGTGTANATNGAALWAAHCQGCHGPAFPNARDSTRTLWAISANRGGMGALASVIGTQQSDDIAAYMATK